MSNDKFAEALEDVRKAYRLIYFYTAGILDAVQRISKEFSCTFYKWTPTYYSNPPKLTAAPFPPRRWSWEMIPLYNTSFLFLSTKADKNIQKKGDWMLDIYIETDSSATEKLYEREEEPTPIDFDPPEEAESVFILNFIYCTKPNKFNWYYDLWSETGYPEEEVGEIESEKYKGLKYVGKTYKLEKLFTEEGILECTNDFKNLIRNNLNINNL